MTYVKICGITRIDDARCAAEAGADLIGFVFYRKSPRFVTPERITAITCAIREEFGASAPRTVGVFVNHSCEFVEAALENTGLDLAQLHGGEQPLQLQRLLPRAFKGLRPRTLEEAEAALAAFAAVTPADEMVPEFLVDAYHPAEFGGTGLAVDLALAKSLACRFRLLLAGGLTPETVGTVIEHVRPWGVDVSSGVEQSKGVKDPQRLRAFIETVHATDAMM